MFIGRALFLAFLLVPIAEIYVLIKVGSVIGAFPTIALVVFTAVLGSILIRAQGLATLARVRTSMARGEVPAMELVEGVCLLVAGALLLTPGFVTDSIGFMLLIPTLRRNMILAVLERGVLRAATGVGASARAGPGAHGAARPIPRPGPRSAGRTGEIIEGEFERKDP
jgi:UPF0716 protein FxsA